MPNQSVSLSEVRSKVFLIKTRDFKTFIGGFVSLGIQVIIIMYSYIMIRVMLGKSNYFIAKLSSQLQFQNNIIFR